MLIKLFLILDLSRSNNVIYALKKTQAFKYIAPEVATKSGATSHKYVLYRSCNLKNGEFCGLNHFIIASNSKDKTLFVGRVLEILQVPSSPSELRREPNFLLLTIYSSNAVAENYMMLRLSNTGTYVLTEFSVCLFLSLFAWLIFKIECAMTIIVLWHILKRSGKNTRKSRQECPKYCIMFQTISYLIWQRCMTLDSCNILMWNRGLWVGNMQFLRVPYVKLSLDVPRQQWLLQRVLIVPRKHLKLHNLLELMFRLLERLILELVTFLSFHHLHLEILLREFILCENSLWWCII